MLCLFSVLPGIHWLCTMYESADFIMARLGCRISENLSEIKQLDKTIQGETTHTVLQMKNIMSQTSKNK